MKYDSINFKTKSLYHIFLVPVCELLKELKSSHMYIISHALYFQEKQLPKEPAFIFVLEMSQLMMQRGVLPLLCQSMKEVLQHLPRDTIWDNIRGTPAEHSAMKVGFNTYCLTCVIKQHFLYCKISFI